MKNIGIKLIEWFEKFRITFFFAFFSLIFIYCYINIRGSDISSEQISSFNTTTNLIEYLVTLSNTNTEIEVYSTGIVYNNSFYIPIELVDTISINAKTGVFFNAVNIDF